MTDKEAMKLALEALENQRIFTLRPDHEGKELTPKQVTDAITALKEALAQQPLMEPEGRCKECLTYNGHHDGCSLATQPAAQPKQKRPQNCGTGYCSCIECVMEPPQRTWAGSGDLEDSNAYQALPAQPTPGDIQTLKHRIHKLEVGYKQMLDLAEEKLKAAQPLQRTKPFFKFRECEDSQEKNT